LIIEIDSVNISGLTTTVSWKAKKTN